MANKWYLIYCKPGQDERAEVNLSKQGFEVFRPKIKVERLKVGGGTSARVESLFPRYVFIYVNPKIQSIAPVSSTFGVVNFVKFGGRYATAPDMLIEEIRTHSENQFFSSDCFNTIKEGDQVYVNGNGFNHVKAIYCSPCGSKRAMILMNILGNEQRINVSSRCLSKA